MTVRSWRHAGSSKAHQKIRKSSTTADHSSNRAFEVHIEGRAAVVDIDMLAGRATV
jgi:hypothetical protein